MNKNELINAIVKVISEVAEERNLNVVDYGTGHAFDNSFWNGVLKDTSDIPEVEASCDDYSIKLRSFWGNPEIDIRDGHDLFVLNYADTVWIGDSTDETFKHTGEYSPYEIRVCSNDYREGYLRLTDLIFRIKEIANSNS